MEIRKLIQSGQSSLVVSLPQKWVETNNLKKGDQIYIDRSDNKLVISSIAKKIEHSEFLIEKNIDTARFLESLLYAGFLSDKKIIVINNLKNTEFYNLLNLLRKFHYLKIEEKTENSIKLSFVLDISSMDLEKEILRISDFFDMFFDLFVKADNKKENLEEIYDQISSQILLCMKVIKLKFLDYNRNIILRMKQQVDSYYFLLITCKTLSTHSRYCAKDKKLFFYVQKLKDRLITLTSITREDNIIEILKFWEINEKDKKELLDTISNEKDIKRINPYFLVYNGFITLENLAYSYINNH